MSPRSALVTGATGYIGAHLVDALVGAGWQVRAAGRRPRPGSLPADVDYAAADLAGDDLDPLTEGITHVFHLAGASSSRSDDAEMQRTNVVGTGRLVAAAASHGVVRFVHMSSTSVYGEEVQLPVPVREDVEVHPSRGYGKAKWGAEEQVWAGAEKGLAAVVLRPVSVYGPGAVKLVASAALDVAIERRAGLDRVAIDHRPIEQRLLHLDDLIRATLHLADHDAAVGRAFNLVSSSYPSSHEVAAILADEFDMGVELVGGTDCGLAHDRRAAVRDEMLAEGMTDDILFTPQRFRFMAKANRNNRLSIGALESTGFHLAHTDTRRGISETVAWYRDHRWLV